MSDKLDLYPVVCIEKSVPNLTSPTPPDAVTNGLENEQAALIGEPADKASIKDESLVIANEDTSTTYIPDSNPSSNNPKSSSKSRKSSISKEPDSSTGNMTNKDIHLIPSHRTRLRSRSKSSNSEDLKSPCDMSLDKVTDSTNPSKEEQTTHKKSSSKSPQKTDEESMPDQSEIDVVKDKEPSETKEEEETPTVNSDEAMEVDEVGENKTSEKADDSGVDSQTISTPMIVEDENSSDFPGFDQPEDKYLAFSVVFRPFEEVALPKRKSKGPHNGPLNSVVKHRPQSPKVTPVRNNPSRVDFSDPEFRKPFEYGWRRELVFRSANEGNLKRNADIYYYTPSNKKVRSLREVLEHIKPSEQLTADNFTFCKESLCVDDPDKEVIREAKWKPNRPSDQDGFYTLPPKKPTVKGKAGKAKEKKESAKEVVKDHIDVSPSSSPSTSTASPLTPRIVMKTSSSFKVNSKKMTLKVEKRRKAAGPDDSSPLNPTDTDWCPESKAQVREMCSIECRLAMGLIPTLQCVKCLCLYHPECVNLPEAKERQIHSYVCKCCQSAAKQTTKLPPPPPLTPILTPSPPKKEKEAVKVVAAPPVVTSGNVSTRSQAIVGAVTTWLPPSSSLQVGGKGPPPIAPRPELESTPQSLISVQGKKYVVIPKVNKVKFDGRSDGGGGEEMSAPTSNNTVQTPNPASVYLVPYNLPSTSGTYVVQTPNTTPPTYIVTSCSTSPVTLTNGLKRGSSDGSGSDGSPPAKMSAVSPKSTPSVKTIAMPKSAPKVAPAPKQGGAKSPARPTSATTQTHITPTTDFMSLFNAGYISLLHAFQYLKVHELLRAACVCKMWRHMATHRTLWDTVKMKNSRVRNWEGFGRSLRSNGTRCLDLKKMLVPEGGEAVAEMWRNMIAALKTVTTLTKIDVGRCSPENLEMVAKACPQLESIVALSIRGQSLDLNMLIMEQLTELRLKSVGGMDLNNFSALKKLTNLKHLSLTSVKKLVGLENNLPASLETLELGECCQMNESFATETLAKMKMLTRLRLEKGQGQLSPINQLINAIAGLENLTQLELINFDIKPGFDKALAKCVHVKTLLIIPTYVTQSATTNHVVMGGVTKLSATLEYFIWGLTLELLRVTDLFIDQVEGQKQKAQAKKGAGDSIPILKPLSDENAEPSREGQTTSQVDILALPKLQRVLSTLLPTTRVKILKVPFSATWRQTVD